MKIGDEVFHRDFGRGRILNLYPEGPTAMVDFGYMTDLVLLAALDDASLPGADVEQEPAAVNPSSPGAAASATRRPPGYGVNGTSRRAAAHPSAVSRDAVAEPGSGRIAHPPPDAVAMGRMADRSSLSAQTVEARRAVIALRLGQVLESHVDDLSVGLNGILERFDATLRQAGKHQPQTLLIEGAWGQGKTHLLTVLTAAAVRHEFAVSSVVLDGVATTLSDPMKLFEAITNGIRFPGDALPGGLSVNLTRARRSGHLERLGHLGATMLAEVFEQIPRSAFEEYDALQIIEDYLGLFLAPSAAKNRLAGLGFRNLHLPPLRARAVAEYARRFCDLLSNWTWLCAVAGARGLVVILDELDVDYASTARRGAQAQRLRERRQDLLEQLGCLRAQRIPLVLAFASAPAAPGIDPEHDASRNLHDVIGGVDDSVVAPVPSEADLQELVKKILALYRIAYPEAVAGTRQQAMAGLTDRLLTQYQRQGNPVPRYFVRSTLESLDLLTTHAD
ncbi:hypothetical protein CKO25_09155 [Thiocapsa imhoffii]|uniref:ATP-binding protein n=1 Tax=Thiocapsa imhoffii TaxID=382777 RepID=A0A9X0WHR0_9GAMM|nr:BREX system ATP-binding domain-containing protein [Thiocapsa imhoffii]MBK1644813.1 hypothetical protein [Thiocapsa imhoffii]